MAISLPLFLKVAVVDHGKVSLMSRLSCDAVDRCGGGPRLGPLVLLRHGGGLGRLGFNIHGVEGCLPQAAGCAGQNTAKSGAGRGVYAEQAIKIGIQMNQFT